MKKEYLLTTYRKTLGKYRKFHHRLMKKIHNGSFQQLSISKRNSLTELVEHLRLKLEALQLKVSALAAAGLISLTVATTNVSAQPFVQVNDINILGFYPATPSPITTYNIYVTVSFGDLDNDGDLDAVTSADGDASYYYGAESFLYFKNTGTNSSPVYEEQTGTNNPLYLASTNEFYSTANLTDMDNDGDLDLVSGGDYNDLFYYKNIGTVSAPIFEEQTGSNNFFNGITFSNINDELYPFAVDIDHDGDKDFFMTDEDSGAVAFYLNTGTVTSALLTEQTGTLNPFNGIFFGYRPRASFSDIDGDGDQDAMIAEYYYNNKIFFYKNTGTISSPAFSEQTGTNSPFTGGQINYFSATSFADLDNDGDLDMFISDYEIHYFENTGTASAPLFGNFVNPSAGLFKGHASPAFADLDNDGDEDVAIGNLYGTVQYYKNNGASSAPLYIAQTGTNNLFNFIGVNFFSSPSFVDIDADGDMDMMLGFYESYPFAIGRVFYIKNVGTASEAMFTYQTGSANPLDAEIFMRSPNPTFSDLDNDGDMDLVVGDFLSPFLYFKNTGTTTSAIFTAQTGADNPLDTMGIGDYFLVPEFTDFDYDGDQDLLAGDYDGELIYYKNTGSASAAVFSMQIGTDNPFDGIMVDKASSPALADVDDDGDIDLFLGDFLANNYGRIYFYQNTKFMAGIGNVSASEKLSAFPNPTNGTLNIMIPSSLEGNASISVMDLSGRTVYNEKKQLLEGILTIDALKEAEKGMYILRISTNSLTVTTKVVKD